MIRLCAVIACVFLLQGCIHKIITTPIKVAYKTTKVAVKGTAAVVGTIIPDGDDEEDEDEKKNKG